MMTRLLCSIWTTRVLMLVAITVNLHSAATNDIAAWRAVAITMTTLLLAVWALVEVRRRQHAAERWQIAAGSSDPVGFLAQTDYMHRLSMREHKAVIDWIIEHEFMWTDDDVDDAPPVVRGWIEAGSRPPREAR